MKLKLTRVDYTINVTSLIIILFWVMLLITLEFFSWISFFSSRSRFSFFTQRIFPFTYVSFCHFCSLTYLIQHIFTGEKLPLRLFPPHVIMLT